MKLNEVSRMRFKKGDKENFIIVLSRKFMEAFEKGKPISKSVTFDNMLSSFEKQNKVSGTGWRSKRMEDKIIKAAIEMAIRDFKQEKRK